MVSEGPSSQVLGSIVPWLLQGTAHVMAVKKQTENACDWGLPASVPLVPSTAPTFGAGSPPPPSQWSLETLTDTTVVLS